MDARTFSAARLCFGCAHTHPPTGKEPTVKLSGSSRSSIAKVWFKVACNFGEARLILQATHIRPLRRPFFRSSSDFHFCIFLNASHSTTTSFIVPTSCPYAFCLPGRIPQTTNPPLNSRRSVRNHVLQLRRASAQSVRRRSRRRSSEPTVLPVVVLARNTEPCGSATVGVWIWCTRKYPKFWGLWRCKCPWCQWAHGRTRRSSNWLASCFLD